MTSEGNFENGRLISGRRTEHDGKLWHEGTFKNQSLYNGKFYKGLGDQKVWGSLRHGKPVGDLIIEEDGKRVSGSVNRDGSYNLEKCYYIGSGRSCMPSRERSNHRNNNDQMVEGITAILNAIILSQ